MHSVREDLTASLTSVPRLSREDWQRKHLVVRWLIATRASVLVMTFSAAAVGGLLALLPAYQAVGTMHPERWLLATIGLLLAHATNNLLNDLTDTLRGVDTGNYFRAQYGTHVLQHGLISQPAMWGYIAVTGIAALLIGLLLTWLSGPALLAPVAFGAFFLVFYTWPLKQWGMGEVAVLLVWGPLMVAGTFMATTGVWSWPVAAIGTLFGLGPTLVIFGKHIDKIEFDAGKGVATLPVRLGEARSRQWVVVMIALMYISLVALVAFAVLPVTTLLALITLPTAWRTVTAFRVPRPSERPDDWPETLWPLWYAAIAFALARNFGLCFVVGLLAGSILQQFA